MGWSGVTITEAQGVDIVSPGAPGFTGVNQIDNHQWELNISLPLQDADGTELTGLTKLGVATMPMTGGDNPFIGLSWAEIENLSGVVLSYTALSPSDAGTVKTVNVPVTNLGGMQAFAAAVSDAV